MRKFLLLFSILIIFSTGVFAQVGDTDSPFSTSGWEEPVDSTNYYKLFIYRLLSNPGGWINWQTQKIDSLLNALVVYTDTTEMYIENDTLRLSPYAMGELQHDTASVIVVGTGDHFYTVVLFDVSVAQNVTYTDSTIIIEKAGNYFIAVSSSFTHSVNNTLCHFAVFINDTLDTDIQLERKIGTGGDFGNEGANGINVLSVGDTIKVKAKSDNIGNLTINHMNFNLHKIK